MFTALLDANVLAPVSLTDTILRAAERELFVPRWSAGVLGEVHRALRRIRSDVPTTRLRARLEAMNDRFPEARVTGHEGLLESIALPDPNDRHVVAAAVVGRADVIVTRDLKHFPDDNLAPWALEAVDPDTFLRDMLDLFPDIMLRIVVERAADLRRPSQGVGDVLASLQRAGVTGFVADLRARFGDAVQEERQRHGDAPHRKRLKARTVRTAGPSADM